MNRPDDMTEPDDDTQDDQDRAWFRAAVEPQLNREPVTPGWAAITDQIDGCPEELASPRAPAKHRTLRAALAVAAALALLAGIAAVVRSATDADRAADSLSTTEPPPTGWYVPDGLREGWELLRVDATDGGPVCERRGTQWTDPAGERSVGLFFDACATPPTEADEFDSRPMDEHGDPVVYQDEEGNEFSLDGPRTDAVAIDLGGGVTGVSMVFQPPEGTPEPLGWLAWDMDGGWSLNGLGLSEEQLIAAARNVVADPTRSELDVDGLEALQMVEQWEAPARDHSPNLDILVETPGGQQLLLMVGNPGAGGRPAGQDVLIPEAIEGQPNLTFRYESPTWAAVRFGGPWPGADVSFMRLTNSPADPNQTVSDDQLRTFIGSLRPATATEWREYLDTATGPVSDVAQSAPDLVSLFDPANPPVEARPTNPPSEPEPVEPLDIPAPFPGVDMFLTSEAGTTVDDGNDNRDHLSNLDGLEVRLELPGTPLPSGGRLDASLLLVNPTDQAITINECTSFLTRWGLVRNDPLPPDLPSKVIIDCGGTPITTIPAGGSARQVLDGLSPVPGFVARAPSSTGPHLYGAALEPGPYLAAVEVPGANGTIRVEMVVEVSEPACPPITEAVATRYLERSEHSAVYIAAADKQLFQVVQVDGVPQPAGDWVHNCERINATVVDGQVVWVELGP